MIAGGLIGQKIVLNEFVAYLQLADIVTGQVAGVGMISEHSRLIATYALCGFANFSLDRDPDRRHRRPGAGTPRRPRPLRPARGAGRLASPP